MNSSSNGSFTAHSMKEAQIVLMHHVNIYFPFPIPHLTDEHILNDFPSMNSNIYLWISIAFARIDAKFNANCTFHRIHASIANGFRRLDGSFFQNYLFAIEIQMWNDFNLIWMYSSPNKFLVFFFDSQLVDEQNRVWLLLYDLHMRHFLKRDPKERIREKELYRQSNVEGEFDLCQSRNWINCWSFGCRAIEIYKCIWNDRIHLAASLARLRIKNSALSLLHLLPLHLQDNKVAIATANPIVTGWINPFRLRWERTESIDDATTNARSQF